MFRTQKITMKKLVFFLLSTMLLQGAIQAQTAAPVIKDLKMLIQSAQDNFKDQLGEKVETDTVNKMIFYKTKMETAAAQTFILHLESNEKNIYVIKYNMKTLDVNLLKMLSIIVNLYVDELNNMVKSGNYTGRDYTDTDGMSITEINDNAGNHILDYSSNSETQNIYVFGLIKN